MSHRRVPVSRFVAATTLAVVASLAVPSIPLAAASPAGSPDADPVHQIEQLATRPADECTRQPRGARIAGQEVRGWQRLQDAREARCIAVGICGQGRQAGEAEQGRTRGPPTARLGLVLG